jgi:hypothetical protein
VDIRVNDDIDYYFQTKKCLGHDLVSRILF